ncbi:MAG TPA: alpha-L-fucosidase [Candidatus Hydrogenedentes bacterium]|nr:alpha-L-fucosidase [Candidatus Hydrogenedentota bacterium]
MSAPMWCKAQVAPPDPIHPTPTSRQLAWHALEFYGFIHFTINTFTDKEWGYGDEPPSLFNPTALDVGQWVAVAKDAGMTGLILTAKHHDGFCLWPSQYTEHSVKNSPYKNGKGDIVGELAKACAEAGLKFGVYLSPWDRNHADYGRPEYIPYFRNQLRELLTNYGPVFEVWFDGANGGTGYYGGARQERSIDRATYYDWENTWSLVRALQPKAVLFSDIGPDIRWVGNEKGIAGDPCWATYSPKSSKPGIPPAPGQTLYEEAQNGHADGALWLPAEADVSIRPGWFYHAAEDAKVRTPEDLVNLYYHSVGRGATLLLNLPPDRRGLIHENDVAALRGMRKILDETFKTDLTKDAMAKTSNFRGYAEEFGAARVLDGDRNTFWTTDDDVTKAYVEISFPEQRTASHIVLQEYIELGQRILRFTVEARIDGAWRAVAKGTSIGWKRILRIEPATTDAMRIRIDEAKASPMLASLSIY